MLQTMNIISLYLVLATLLGAVLALISINRDNLLEDVLYGNMDEVNKTLYIGVASSIVILSYLLYWHR